MAVNNVILVGVDGSSQSLDAVRWAGARAAHTGSEVHLVCAYSLPSFTASSLDGGYTAFDDTSLQEGAQTILDEAKALITDPQITVRTITEPGDPTGVLVDFSKEVKLIAVGTRGRGGFADRLLGTVSSALPAHTQCPCVVIPTYHQGALYTPVKRIVVGVDGSGPSASSLQFAIQEAMIWNAELTVISAVPMASGSGMLAWLPAAVDRDAVLADVRAGIDQSIAQAQAKIPGSEKMKIRRHALDGNAAALLSEFSTAVELLVVGTRGRGGFAGLLLGSTSQAVLNHAVCPIMVVPTRPDTKDEMPKQWERR